MIQTRPKMKSKPGDRERRISLDRIYPSPENAKLYRPVDPLDPDIQALAESIRKDGVLDPLVISRDRFIISGHRRWTAAGLAGLKRVPCRIEPVDYLGCDEDQWVHILREYNRQRVKSLDEIIREEVVSADPDLAYDRLLEYRRKAKTRTSPGLGVELDGFKGRDGISKAKTPMLNAAIEAFEGRREYWPLSVRQVHYLLLNRPPLRHASKPRSTYKNDRQSYQDLCDLLTRARLDGTVPWDALSDDTRPVTIWRSWANAQDFIREELDSLFKGYHRDLQRTQPNHIEIVGEKMTVQTIIERVAMRYMVPVTIGRGYSSITPRYDMAQRFRRTGKDRLVVLILGDFDPDGDAIVESFARSMRDDFDVDDLLPIRVALTEDQTEELNLVPSMEAKKSSVHYKKFKRAHGKNVFELEAVSPDDLSGLLTEAIESVLDVELFNAEVDAERTDAAFLEEARQRACLALGGMKGDSP